MRLVRLPVCFLARGGAVLSGATTGAVLEGSCAVANGAVWSSIFGRRHWSTSSVYANSASLDSLEVDISIPDIRKDLRV